MTAIALAEHQDVSTCGALFRPAGRLAAGDSTAFSTAEQWSAVQAAAQKMFKRHRSSRALPRRPDLDGSPSSLLLVDTQQAAQVIGPVWPVPCEELFQQQALSAPGELVRALQEQKLEDANLSFAAEAAGQLADRRQAIAALRSLLHHRSAIVREGAIYGLMPHLDDRDQAAPLLDPVAQDDPSAAVRSVAQEALSAFD